MWFSTPWRGRATLSGGIRPWQTAHRVFMLNLKIKIVASGPKGIKLWQGEGSQKGVISRGNGGGAGAQGTKSCYKLLVLI